MVQEEGTGRGPSPPSPLLAVPNVTAHPSTASVPITVLPYNSTLLCSFNGGIKGLRHAITKNGVISEKLVHCIFIFWVNIEIMTG